MVARVVGFYFFDSFLVTGMQTVIPQIYFLSHYELDEKVWLGICLLAGALGIVLGAHLSRHYSLVTWIKKAPGPSLVVGGYLINMGLFLTLFWCSSVVVYVILYAVVELFQAYWFSTWDNVWLQILPITQIRTFVTRAILFQSLGNILAPLFFTWGWGIWGAALAVVLGTVVNVSAFITVKSQVSENIYYAAQLPMAPLVTLERWFVLYALMIYGALMVLTANVLYLLGHFYVLQSDQATKVAGYLLAISNLVGILMVMGYLGWNQHTSSQPIHDRGYQRGPQRWSLAGILIAFGLFFVKLSTHLPYLLLLGALIGSSFGIFRLMAREFASRRVALTERTWLLTIFNNLHGFAQLLAFGAMIIMTLGRPLLGLSLTQGLFVIMGLFLLVAVVSMVNWERSLHQETLFPSHKMSQLEGSQEL